MTEKQLREFLEELQLELMRVEPADESTRKRADELARGIREALNRPSLSGYPVSMSDLLNDSLATFEATHPRVAELARVLIDALAKIGL